MGTDERIAGSSHYYPGETSEYDRMVLGKWGPMPSTTMLVTSDHTERIEAGEVVHFSASGTGLIKAKLSPGEWPMDELESAESVESKLHALVEQLRASLKKDKMSGESLCMGPSFANDVICEYDTLKSERTDLLECLFKMQEEIDDKTQALKDVMRKVESDTHGLKGVVLTAEATEDVHNLCDKAVSKWDDK